MVAKLIHCMKKKIQIVHELTKIFVSIVNPILHNHFEGQM